MSNNRRKKPTNAENKEEDDDPVQQLLQSAQDELLLKLSVDSHMSRVSPDYLLPDLDRRFHALKSRPSSSTIQPPPPPLSSTAMAPESPTVTARQDNNDADANDLFARFAALKASNNTKTSTVGGTSGFDQVSGDDDEEDEVEKIIKWAKDAARLDPSPPSDDEDGDDDSVDDDEELGQVPEKGHSK